MRVSERVVEQLGKAVAIRILKATKDVEEGGGMYTVVCKHFTICQR